MPPLTLSCPRPHRGRRMATCAGAPGLGHRPGPPAATPGCGLYAGPQPHWWALKLTRIGPSRSSLFICSSGGGDGGGGVACLFQIQLLQPPAAEGRRAAPHPSCPLPLPARSESQSSHQFFYVNCPVCPYLKSVVFSVNWPLDKIHLGCQH